MEEKILKKIMGLLKKGKLNSEIFNENFILKDLRKKVYLIEIINGFFNDDNKTLELQEVIIEGLLIKNKEIKDIIKMIEIKEL